MDPFVHTPRPRRMLWIAVLCAGILHGCSDSSDDMPSLDRDPALSVYKDPGTGEWETVPRDRLIADCGLDPDILDEVDATATHSYAVVRYGKLCHEFYHPNDPGRDEQARNASATKTLGAVIIGRAVEMSTGLARPLRDTDRMDSWIDDIGFNPDALVAHVLAMVGSSESLGIGQRYFEYDGDGSREINRLIDVVEAVLAQDPGHFSGAETMAEFNRREVFDRLGMDNSSWPGESIGTSWDSDLRDMARIGLLLLHNGVWDQQRLLSEKWVYRMTHPAFEDANTGYGYLTWVAANRNWSLLSSDARVTRPFGSCQPYAVWPEYPHALSEVTDCNFDGAYPCTQIHDVGVFGAAGAGGQLIVGHRALDLVLVTRNAGLLAFLHTPWELMRRALIAQDPLYAGDEDAFCAAYEAGDYAPDFITGPAMN